jgi:23S rRNA (cytosine1962-C5)-methyltransferase
MPVRPMPSGHVGLFPEQADNWKWLAAASPIRKDVDAEPRLALNLFGHTGASTMALAIAGYHVAHVDAARPSVQAARMAAQHNELAEAPIRYLVDDAIKFAAREVRRNRRYHTIVLDPPAYGHSPDGRAWRLQRDLWPLLDNCFRLLDPAEFRLLITGHSAEVDQSNVTEFLKQSAFIRHTKAASGLNIQSGRSQLTDTVGRDLDSGFYVRAQSGRL